MKAKHTKLKRNLKLGTSNKSKNSKHQKIEIFKEIGGKRERRKKENGCLKN